MTRAMTTPHDVLDFWFGVLDAEGVADAEHTKRWFIRDPVFDEAIRARFLDTRQVLAETGHADWSAEDRGLLAAIIVLDQFSRNLFRGSAEAFATDAQALALAEEALRRGMDRSLSVVERMFVYLPFVHSEDLRHQDRSVALFTALRDEALGPAREAASGALAFAEKHRDIVRRFGRFPMRNAALGRQSTEAERAYIEAGGPF